MKNKPNDHFSAEQASIMQMLMVESINPQIEYNRNQALALSPPIREGELINFEKLPDDYIQAVEKAGLSNDLKRVPVKTLYQAPITGDKILHFLMWINKYDKVEKFRTEFNYIIQVE